MFRKIDCDVKVLPWDQRRSHYRTEQLTREENGIPSGNVPSKRMVITTGKATVSPAERRSHPETEAW